MNVAERTAPEDTALKILMALFYAIIVTGQFQLINQYPRSMCGKTTNRSERIMNKNYNHITLRFAGSGHYHIAATRENDCFTAITTDMETVDLFKSEKRGWKTAGNKLHDFAVRTGFKTIIG